METCGFHIGDVVEYINENSYYSKVTRGMTGTVLCFINNGEANPSIGVGWDEYIDGHDLDGHCEDGYGWYVGPNEILKLDDDGTEYSFDEDLFSAMLGGS